MALKNLFLIVCLLIFAWGSECPDSFIEIDEICYYKKHLDVLQDFIDENQSLHGMEPHKIGYQEWKNNRLTYLYLGDNKIMSIQTFAQQVFIHIIDSLWKNCHFFILRENIKL